MKRLLWLLLVLTLAGGGWGVYTWRRNIALAAEAPKVQTAKVERGSIKLSVQATASMASNLDVNITCKSAGEVIIVPFDISDSVKKGDLLMEIDPIDAQRALDLAAAALDSSKALLGQAQENLKVSQMQLATDSGRTHANVRSAEATAERAKIKMGRIKQALAAHADTQEDYDQSVTDWTTAGVNVDLANIMVDDLKREEAALDVIRQTIKLDEAQVKSNQVNLEIAQQHVDECKVYAPMDGVISNRTVQIGNIVASSITNVGGGTACFVLSDLSRVFAMANVDESDIGRVRLGQLVNVTADSYPGKRFSGKITRIATTGANVSNVVTFQVQIEIVDDKKYLLKPQMTTNCEIIAAEKDDVLILSNDSITRKKGKAIVDVEKPDGTTEERTVTTGINDGDRSEITGGVEEGETVVVHKAGADRWSGGNRQQGPNFNPMMGGPPGGAPGGGGGRR